MDLPGGGHAHLTMDRAVAGLPEGLRGARPPGLPHTPWRPVEPMRVAPWETPRLTVEPAHASPELPHGY